MKFVYHPRCLEHVQWAGHPERPERVKAIVEALGRLRPQDPLLGPELATKRDALRVHDEAFVEKMATAREGPYDADTFLHKDTYAHALMALGGALLAARTTVRDRVETFALTRPPGHHAGAAFAGGFCYFNNAAVAADFLAREEGLRPVAVLDFDVHHGNGTQDIFRKRKDALYISTHQAGIYPGTGLAKETGEGPGEGWTVNVPLPEGSGDATFRMAWDRLLLPLLEAARPKAVVVSLGLDAHYADPLGGLSLSSPAYIDLCARAAAFARERAGLPAVFVLEGGYDLVALGETVAGLSERLDGGSPKTTLNDVRDPSGLGARAVDAAAAVHAKAWGLEPARPERGGPRL